jgi:hypothetical protein
MSADGVHRWTMSVKRPWLLLSAVALSVAMSVYVTLATRTTRAELLSIGAVWLADVWLVAATFTRRWQGWVFWLAIALSVYGVVLTAILVVALKT